MPRPSNRDHIVQAAAFALEMSGHFTLDTVAADCKISKAGLLYHFKSVNALREEIFKQHLHPEVRKLVKTAVKNIKPHGKIAMAFAKYLL